jgi:hypothetical protein
LTEKMRSETDPLKIVNIVDATRTQAEKNAQKHKQLDADLTALTTEQAAQRDARTTQLAALEAVKTQLTQHQTTQSQLQTERDTVISANAKALTAARAQLKQLQQQQVALEKAIADRQQELMRAEHRLREWFGSTHRVNALSLDKGMFVFALDSFLPKEAAQLATLVTYLLTAGAAKVGIYSSYFDINLRSELQRWAAQYDIDVAKIEIINPLLQLQASDAAITPTKIQLPEAASESWNAEHTQLELQMSDPQLVLRVQYDAAQISDITYLNAGQPVKHSFFSRQGHLLANALFDAQGALKQEEYYRQDGILALTIMYADGKQNSVEVFDQNGVLRRAFNNTEALIAWWQKGAFTEETRLVGRFQHPAYTALLAQSQATAVPYLEPDDVARAHFTATLKDTETTAFIVADYAVAQALIRTADRDLHLLQLDDVNLPFRIASPKVTPQ